MTRPEFLMKFITSDGEQLLDIEEIKKVLPVSYNLIYATYTILMESDLKLDDVPYVNNDGETIVLKFSNKKLPKEIQSNFHKKMMRLGLDYYLLKIKDKDSYLFISIALDHSDRKQLEEDD